MLYYILLSYTFLYYIIVHCAMLCYAVAYYIIVYYVVLYHVMSCGSQGLQFNLKKLLEFDFKQRCIPKICTKYMYQSNCVSFFHLR